MAIFRLTLIKASPYKTEVAEEWSNSYYFDGTEPTTATLWDVFARAVWAQEGEFIQAARLRTHMVHAYGYSPGSDVAVWSGDYTAGGTSAGIVPTGLAVDVSTVYIPTIDVCGLLRWQCGLSAHTGKPRYIMKYIHDVFGLSTEPNEHPVITSVGTAALAHFTDGSLPGAGILCAPDGTHASGGIYSQYLTTHQLKRRGKRPRRGA